MPSHEWEYEVGEGFEPGRAVLEELEGGELSWSITSFPRASVELEHETMGSDEAELFAREILRLADENRTHEKGSRLLLKAFSILAHEMWACFKEDMGLDSDAIREALESAGLIEMLADQSWSLTELGGRACRRAT